MGLKDESLRTSGFRAVWDLGFGGFRFLGRLDRVLKVLEGL